MGNRIITISRKFGSSGHALAEAVSDFMTDVIFMGSNFIQHCNFRFAYLSTPKMC